MIRGTTPTHIFDIPFDIEEIKEVKITYAQADNVILEKHSRDCDLTDKTITVVLSQEDTFAFDHKLSVEVQVRILTTGGDVLSTIPIEVGVSKCLDNEVL